MATQEIVMPNLANSPAASIPKRRPDAGPISQAAIFHMQGDLAGALKCLSSVSSELETPDLLRARGYLQLELADFAAAEHSYSAAAELEPDSVENWFQWGFCLHKTGELAQALKAFEKAAAIGTDWVELPLARSVCHLGLKQYEKAIEKADECLQLNPDYTPALFTKAVALHLTWNLDLACEIYSKVVALDPACTQARMNLITAGIQRKKYDVVQAQSEGLAAIDNDNVLAIEGMAVAAFARENFAAARQHYNRLTQLAPDQVEHWLNLGIALRRLSVLAEALPCFVKARELRPDSVHAHTHLAETAWDLKDFNTARSCYEAAVGKWPEREEFTLSLSHVLEDMQLRESAERACESFCEKTPDKEPVWFRLGFLQLQRNAYQESVASFERALAIRPDWPDAEINISLALLAAGDLDKAEAKLTGLLIRKPGNVEAAKGLATIALQRKDDEKALEIHAQLIELGEKTADVYYNCGVLAQNLNRIDEAVRFYREAIALRKDFPEALLNLGHALKIIGNDDQARSLWIPALELNPELSLNYFRRR